MGYYQGGDNCYGRGDYYRGDYYRGDIFGSIFKGIKSVAKTAVSLLPGPVGAVARAVTGVGRSSVAVGPAPGPLAQPVISYAPGIAQGAPFAPPLPFGPNVGPGGPGTALANIPGRGVCVIDTRNGKRLGRTNKSTYITRGGGTSRWPQQLIVHPAGTECVRSRRMNVANPRALRRAIRRAQGFSKLARRVLTFVSAKAPKGRAKFKRKK